MCRRIGLRGLALCVAVLLAQCVYGGAHTEGGCGTPKIRKLVPDEGYTGEQVTIKGKKFGDEAGLVAFYPGVSAAITAWSDEQIEVTVPDGAETGWVIVLKRCGKASKGQGFTVEQTPVPDMVLIPAGTFTMGSPDSDPDATDDEKPQHEVTISRPFYMSATEITQTDYENVMGTNPSSQPGPQLPVGDVAWLDAVKYCNARSAQEGLNPVYGIDGRAVSANFMRNGYRLPTEAEREYACRAGTTTRYYWGDDAARVGEYAWYRGNSGGLVHSVGQKQPNAWGLFDMVGNAEEWCHDWYGPYQAGAQTDPEGPESGSYRLVRGGSPTANLANCRSADRNETGATVVYPGRGFRVVRSLPDMVLIPAADFQMGDTFDEGEADELPVHAVYVSAFYMGKYEVTNGQVREVMQWAYDNGKVTADASAVRNAEGNAQELLDLDSPCQISFSGDTFTVDTGKGNYPCVEVTWYGAGAFCNYRSEMEDRTPCYNFSDWSCNWSANGYRLPTEAEWEKAARGGVAGHRFPWSDVVTVTHERANYFAEPDLYDYDVNPTSGFHPDYDDGGYVRTCPVGDLPAGANDYGLYNMAGNVWELCWDWYAPDYYDTSPSTDPTGPASGSYRVVRGGGWSGRTFHCRVASRIGYAGAAASDAGNGFRLALPAGQQ